MCIPLREPTRRLLQEAATAGFYVPEYFADQRFPRVQILTIADLLESQQDPGMREARQDMLRYGRFLRQGSQCILAVETPWSPPQTGHTLPAYREALRGARAQLDPAMLHQGMP